MNEDKFLSQEWLDDLLWKNTPEWKKAQLIEERNEYYEELRKRDAEENINAN